MGLNLVFWNLFAPMLQTVYILLTQKDIHI